MSNTTFVPEPGRIVMVRYVRNGEVHEHPGVIVQVNYPPHIRVSILTNDPEVPVYLQDVNQRTDVEGHGWYRPGDWPQPTLGS